MRCVLQSVYTWLPQTMTWLYQQISNLPGWRSVVLCQKVENADQFPWSDVHCLEDQGKVALLTHKLCRTLGLRRHPTFFDRVADEVKPSLLHSHFGPQGWKDILIARRLGIPQIVNFYGFDVGMLPHQEPIWRERYAEMFELAAAIICEGPHMASCIRDLGCPPDKLHIHHLGVDLDMLPFRPRTWTPNEPLRMLCASAFREKKGLEYAVEAVGLFQRKHPDFEVELTIIGDASGDKASIEVKQTLLHLIEEWGLSEHVRLLGFQPFTVLIEEAYQHHIFLSPSVTAADGDTEGGAPVSIIQMAAMGMPIIATTHCDIPHVLAQPNRALLVPERDPEALAGVLAQLARDPAAWEHIARMNRDLVEKEFCAGSQGEKLAAIYDQTVLISASSSGRMPRG